MTDYAFGHDGATARDCPECARLHEGRPSLLNVPRLARAMGSTGNCGHSSCPRDTSRHDDEAAEVAAAYLANGPATFPAPRDPSHGRSSDHRPEDSLAEAIERIRVHHDKTLGHSPTNRIGYCAEPDGISATYCETGILLAGLR